MAKVKYVEPGVSGSGKDPGRQGDASEKRLLDLSKQQLGTPTGPGNLKLPNNPATETSKRGKK